MKQIYKDLRSTILVALIAFGVCWICNIWVFNKSHHADPDRWLKQQLRMTAAQEKQLETVEQNYAKRRSELHGKIKAANKELAKALMEEKQYSPRVKAASERVSQLQSELKDATIEHFYDMQPVMTPEQLSKVNQLAAQALSQYE